MRRKIRINVILRLVRVTTFVVEKVINLICSESKFVALVIQHAMRMLRSIVTCGLAGCTLFLFPHYLINSTVFGNKVTEHKICVFITPQISSQIFLILRRIQRDIIKNLTRTLCKASVIFCQILTERIF
jgi:hypothetical protein